MSALQQDYILRQIELLRQFVARIVSGGGTGHEQALQQAMHLQEKLFAMPAAEFLRQPVDSQIELLRAGEPVAAASQKCLTYARLLQEMARLYRHRGQDDLADGASQLALHVALHTALTGPDGRNETRALVREVLAALDPATLHAPTRELLDRYAASAG